MKQPASISVVKIKSIKDLSFDSEKRYWYRGHVDAGWALTAGVFRENFRKEWEALMYLRFCDRAPALDRNFPYSVRKDTDAQADALFAMRHHGLPTRVLDWSASLLVGLYFAVADAQKSDRPNGCLWQLLPDELNQQQGENSILFQTTKKVEEIIALGFSKKKDERPVHIAVSPRRMYLRQSAQQATYTIQGDSSRIDQLPNADKFLRKFIVPSAAKIKIMRELYKLGINDSILFPDLDGLARHIRRDFFRTERSGDSRKRYPPIRPI